MAANVDDNVGLEDVSQIFIERQVLMMRRHDVGAVQAVRVSLPSTLWLRPDENAPK